ncbi:unnamed protein product [Peniophora sp. CBMAI 1063]|nr:unnamed protein product [Peniophora sp. CBMAI 1063]
MSAVSRTVSRASTAIPSVKPGPVRNSPLRAAAAVEKTPRIDNRVYAAKAVADARGRFGTVATIEKEPWELQMSPPAAMGGTKRGQNPEQLFAMAYAACFSNAIQQMASYQGKLKIARNTRTRADVVLGHGGPKSNGFDVEVIITVEGCDDDALIAAANQRCPYSRLVRDGAVRILKA